jgi:diacylglycerol kinase (ATP)
VSLHVVINRNARRLRESSAAGRRAAAVILEAARDAGARVHETHDLAALDRAARAMAAAGATTVVLAGGDGSTMAGVTALRRAFGDALPRIAIAPAGTVGVIARNLRAGGGSRDPAAVVRAVGRGDAREATTPTLHVRDDAGGDRVAFIFGAGLVARFFEVYDAAPRQGLGAAARIAGRAFAGSIVGTAFARRMLSPVGATVRVDGIERSSDGRGWSLVLASVVRDVGLGVRATYRAGERADRFHVVASARSPRGLATQVPRVLTGRAMTGATTPATTPTSERAGAVDALAARLDVIFDGPAGATSPPQDGYIVDGDALRAREVTVEAGPLLRVLIG